MRIDLQIDSTELVLRLRNGDRRLAYAVVNAINNTAKRIQDAERRRVEEEFTIRKKEFIRREAAVIRPFASVKQARAFAEIAVGQKPRLLLTAFERGAEREPFTPGATKVAEPVIGGPARPQFAAQVTPELHMARLRFDRTKTRRRRVGVTRTKTYLIPTIGIFQRIGKEATRCLPLHARQVHRAPPPLHPDRRERSAAMVRRGDGAGGDQCHCARSRSGPVSEPCITCGTNPRRPGHRRRPSAGG